ncbi:MAG: DNA-binding protein WhiA [Ruminococcus sp.]|nr:DNA-binding protein WhiA [Ruminococcus sp.]
MSFSANIKQELCKSLSDDRDLLKAELYGILLFGKTFSASKIIFTTENIYACKRVTELLQLLYTPIIEKQTDLRTRSTEKQLHKIIIIDSDECKKIFGDFGHSDKQVTLRVNRANIFTESLLSAFIRGVFLSCGSVSDPNKGYHAEFCVPHKNLSMDLCRLLTEIDECSFAPKTITRNGSYVIYFKGSEQICDMLTFMGATNSAMEIMGTKAVKQVRNNINRRINSEVANITKIASASAKQLKAIDYIEKTMGIDSLPDDLREIAHLRLENPEMSLRDLGNSLIPPISRSGANHRMQRLMEYAQIEEIKNG